MSQSLIKLPNGEVRDENQVYIVWNFEDVKALYPGLSDDKALEALQTVASILKDRSTEEGWAILEAALEFVFEEEA